MSNVTWNQVAADGAMDPLVGRLHRAVGHLQAAVKRGLSVPAPRAPGSPPRAKTPAVKGAKPRKLSGRLRASVATEVDEAAMVGRVGTNVFYGRIHEEADHPWLDRTLQEEWQKLQAILAGKAT